MRKTSIKVCYNDDRTMDVEMTGKPYHLLDVVAELGGLYVYHYNAEDWKIGDTTFNITAYSPEQESLDHRIKTTFKKIMELLNVTYNCEWREDSFVPIYGTADFTHDVSELMKAWNDGLQEVRKNE